MTSVRVLLMRLFCVCAFPLLAGAQDAPRLKVDPFWPKPLPNNWMVGHVEGVVADKDDHIWMLHHVRTMDHPQDHSEMGRAQHPPVADCCVPAPELIEFDAQGNVMQAWGVRGTTPGWPEAARGLAIDKQGNIWISGNHAPDRAVLKYSQDGKLLLKIGQTTNQAGLGLLAEPNNQDTTLLGGPTSLIVDDDASEIYIADGAINKRILVFDTNTGAFKRGWGAYGIPLSEIDNSKLAMYNKSNGPYDPMGTPPKQFRGLWAIRLSADGLVYVGDGKGNRIQVFTKAGKFVKEIFVARGTLMLTGTVFDIAFSHDRGQKYLLVADPSNNVIRILNRNDGTPVGKIGHMGHNAGQFDKPAALGFDSHGDLFVGEVHFNNRIQKFVPEK
ncbi:MAG TPA: NHL repeat-containing protein [Acidobacteriaceae bacterium]